MYKVFVSETDHQQKPKDFRIQHMSVTILKHPFEFFDVEDLAKKISAGHTVLLSNSRKKTHEEIYQQFVMLDFDNKGETQYTLNDLKKDKFMKENACFYYTTYNHTPKLHKFRVCFVLEKPLTSHMEVEEVYKYLFKKYPMSDTTVGQATRMFFGTDKKYTMINKNNKLTYAEEIEQAVHAIALKEQAEILDSSTPIYRLLELNRPELTKAKFGLKYKRTFVDNFSAVNYFKQLNMAEFLELPKGNFKDIFHPESSASANIFYDEEDGVYLYKCFSNSHPFVGDIFSVLYELNGMGTYLNMQMLLELTGSEMDSKSELAINKYNSDKFKKDLMSGDLSDKHPELYEFLKPYKQEITATLEFMYDYMYLDDNGKPQYLNNYSLKKLRSLVSGSVGYRITEAKMRNILNTIVVTEIIRKVPPKNLPKELQEKLLVSQLENEHTRMVSTYNPQDMSKQYKQYVEGLAKTFRENNIKVSSLSYELIYRLFDENKAKKDFPQSYEPLVEKGLIKMSKSDSNLTNKSIQFEKSVAKLVMTTLEEKGYIFEKDLIATIGRTKKMKQETVKKKYYKMRPNLLSNYDLVRRKCTKELHKELGVSEIYSPSIIIFKD